MNYSTAIKRTLFFMVPLIFLSSCALLNEQPSPVVSYEQIPSSTKLMDIPLYGAGHQLQGKPYVFWNFCKQKQKQLSLQSPETSQDSLVYRIWTTNQVGSVDQPHGLLEIRKDSAGWHGQLILMHVNFNYRSAQETIGDYITYKLKPTHLGWDSIAFKLSQLKFDSLPTDDAIPNYYVNGSGYDTNKPTFSFEYATKSQYRFYQYGDIYRAPDKFWQAQHIIEILDLLEEEFHWNDLARKYFK